MKYRDLVQFEPINSVVQLTETAENSKKMVQSYVISDGMMRQLKDILVPQLRLDTASNHKGMFVVGNYGSGKSHLMSVIAAVAENAALLENVRSEPVRKSFTVLAGKFMVIRREVGSSTMSLRDIITGFLSEGLADMGVKFEFPDASKVKANKPDLVRMMSAFKEKSPDKGLLFVLDELLDYLRTRPNQALIGDLSFLREVGEVCGTTPFRFITGVQEMLFSNPAFQFAAD